MIGHFHLQMSQVDISSASMAQSGAKICVAKKRGNINAVEWGGIFRGSYRRSGQEVDLKNALTYLAISAVSVSTKRDHELYCVPDELCFRQ